MNNSNTYCITLNWNGLKMFYSGGSHWHFIYYNEDAKNFDSIVDARDKILELEIQKPHMKGKLSVSPVISVAGTSNIICGNLDAI